MSSSLLGESSAFSSAAFRSIDEYRLQTKFCDDHVEHEIPYSDQSRGYRRRIKIQKWVKVKELGRGGFGTVDLQMEKKTKRLRAVKQVPLNSSNAKVIPPLRELTAMAAVSRDEANFVKLLGWYQSERYLYITMEHLAMGDLRQNIAGPLGETEAKSIIFQVTEALEFMHKKNVAHRDIKPTNIFVVRGAPDWWVKVADFGISKLHGEDTPLKTALAGGSEFVSPELEELTPYPITNATDMWSVGCLASWLTISEILPKRPNLIKFAAGRYRIPPSDFTSKGISEIGAEFILKLLQLKPDERLSAVSALVHPWLIDCHQPIVVDDDVSDSDIGEHLPRKAPRRAQPIDQASTSAMKGKISPNGVSRTPDASALPGRNSTNYPTSSSRSSARVEKLPMRPSGPEHSGPRVTYGPLPTKTKAKIYFEDQKWPLWLHLDTDYTMLCNWLANKIIEATEDEEATSGQNLILKINERRTGIKPVYVVRDQASLTKAVFRCIKSQVHLNPNLDIPRLMVKVTIDEAPDTMQPEKSITIDDEPIRLPWKDSTDARSYSPTRIRVRSGLTDDFDSEKDVNLRTILRLSSSFASYLQPEALEFMSSVPKSWPEYQKRYTQLVESIHQEVFEPGDAVEATGPNRDAIKTERRYLYMRAQDVLQQLDAMKSKVERRFSDNR